MQSGKENVLVIRSSVVYALSITNSSTEGKRAASSNKTSPFEIESRTVRVRNDGIEYCPKIRGRGNVPRLSHCDRVNASRFGKFR